MSSMWEPGVHYITKSIVDCAKANSWRVYQMTINWRELLPWPDHQRVHYECRRCGTTVDVATDECSVCGSERFVCYEID
jgi:rubrerythrin